MRTLFIIVLLIFSHGSFAQKIKYINADSSAFVLAMEIGDQSAATDALIRIVSKDPNNIEKLYSLAEFYFDTERYDQCINTSYIVIKKKENHEKALLLLANCYDKKNNPSAAIVVYSKLDSIQPSANLKYQLATMLFQKQKFQEALMKLESIIQDSSSMKTSIQITYINDQKQNTQQSVPLMAAAFNMAGFILLQHNEKEKAKQLFTQALQIMPDFHLAKGNLTSISEQ